MWRSIFLKCHLTFSCFCSSTTVELACQETGNETTFNGTKINDKEYVSYQLIAYIQLWLHKNLIYVWILQNFVLKSPAACIKPLEGNHHRGFFSVLFITTLILFISYLVVCMIVRRSRGAVGWEMLPHYDTCMRIPTACQVSVILSDWQFFILFFPYISVPVIFFFSRRGAQVS